MSVRTDPSATKDRRRRRRRLLILLLICLSALPSAITSYISISLFSEGALLTTDAWAPMPIDVRAEPNLLIQATGMLPGDVRGGTLTVTNVGADTLRYALVSASHDADGRGLRAVLQADVRAEGSGCTAFDGAILYSGPLVGAGFGDPATGQHAGDRLLAGGAKERICVRVALPVWAGNRYQRSLTETTFTVVAEHAAGTQ